MALTVVPLVAHDPLPFLLLPLKKRLAHIAGRVVGPRRVATTSLVGHGHVPFGVGCQPRASILIGDARVDDLDVVLKGLVAKVVGVGVVPPLAHARCVGPQARQLRVLERGKPDGRHVGDVLGGGLFQPEGI